MSRVREFDDEIVQFEPIRRKPKKVPQSDILQRKKKEKPRIVDNPKYKEEP